MKKTKFFISTLLVGFLCVLFFSQHVMSNDLNAAEESQLASLMSQGELHQFPELIADIRTKGLGFRAGRKRQYSIAERQFISTHIQSLMMALPFLTAVNYSDMSTSELPAFYQLTQLSALDLSFNMLSRLPMWLLPMMKKFSYLNLERNSFSSDVVQQICLSWHQAPIQSAAVVWGRKIIGYVMAPYLAHEHTAQEFTGMVHSFMLYVNHLAQDAMGRENPIFMREIEKTNYFVTLCHFFAHYSPAQAMALLGRDDQFVLIATEFYEKLYHHFDGLRLEGAHEIWPLLFQTDPALGQAKLTPLGILCVMFQLGVLENFNPHG